MSRCRKFSQSDVIRALRAAEAAGLKVSQYKIDNAGNISVFASAAGNLGNAEVTEVNEWDDVQ